MAMRKRFTSRRRTASPRRSAVNRPWSREEMMFMRKYYRNYETAWVARQLGRTVYSIRYKAVDMSIKKASPSVWRGNRGAVNAFRKSAPRTTRKPATRRVAKRRVATRRTTRTRTFRATSRRPKARKAAPRRTRRTRR